MRISLALLFLASLAATGCNSADTHVRMVPADQADALNTCTTIVEGHVTQSQSRANHTFAEEFLGPEPAEPKNGWMTTFNLRVDKHIKGWSPDDLWFNATDFNASARRSPQSGALPVPKGSTLRMGWNEVFGLRSDVKILILTTPKSP